MMQIQFARGARNALFMFAVVLAIVAWNTGESGLAQDDAGKDGLVSETQKNGEDKETSPDQLYSIIWLLRHQGSDGSWSASDFTTQCKGTPCSEAGLAGREVEMTGLALLAFFNAGYTHLSKQKCEGITAGVAIKNAITWLASVQGKEGCFGDKSRKDFLRAHCVVTWAMCDAYGMTENILFKELAQKAIDFMANAQEAEQLWKLPDQPDEEAVIRSCWAMLVLKSAKMSKDLKIPDAIYAKIGPWAKALKERCFADDCKNKWTENTTICAVFLLTTIFTNEPNATECNIAAEVLTGKLSIVIKESNLDSIDDTCWFISRYALRLYGNGEEGVQGWEMWDGIFRKAKLETMLTQEDGCAWGSLDPVENTEGKDGGRVFVTAFVSLQSGGLFYYAYPPAMMHYKVFEVAPSKSDEEAKNK